MRRLGRWILILLLLELLLAFAVTLRVRRQLAGPPYYIGSARAAGPLLLGRAGPPVLDARQGEEQIG